MCICSLVNEKYDYERTKNSCNTEPANVNARYTHAGEPVLSSCPTTPLRVALSRFSDKTLDVRMAVKQGTDLVKVDLDTSWIGEKSSSCSRYNNLFVW